MDDEQQKGRCLSEAAKSFFGHEKFGGLWCQIVAAKCTEIIIFNIWAQVSIKFFHKYLNQISIESNFLNNYKNTELRFNLLITITLKIFKSNRMRDSRTPVNRPPLDSCVTA